ncbi:helix-turn-helix transcriptional regulator [Streptomyces fuscigenes]|uniref:helix-turn-helix transcriptional regulator n=1 Tax=Streptomyces fuscigenes TaxID=1528880 RepID=UPI001F46C990|nr:helix-turn-helix transcriptional regulator [Streptomyces fuscigenes]MCF3965097.1 helix-turn-helix transcriptional regulator [Streptomyces fuscigenes]
MDQNAELRDFLRSRRARLSPGAAGIVPGGGARRVPGLRREEVARLAGVSTDYYTRLEQGRHPHVSEGVLDAVAGALRLDDVERDYLVGLVRPRSPRPGRRRGAVPQRVRPEVHGMLEVLGQVTPAVVTNHRQDVLASNGLARALFTDFDARAHRERNMARFILFDPSARDLFARWEEVAEVIVASLRLASGHHPDDALLNELIGEAMAKVPRAGDWWAGHRLFQCAHAPMRLHHPVVGDLDLRYESLSFPADPDHDLGLFTAAPGSPSAQALALLASWSAPERRPDEPVPGHPGAVRPGLPGPGPRQGSV